MRRGALSAARLALLAGPAALAFFAGGYFDGPRAWAGAGVWVIVAVAAVLGGRALPRSPATWVTVGALTGLAAWTLLSMLWAPTAGAAYHAGQIAVLYLGALVAAAILLRDADGQALVEPLLAAGAVIVIGYGLSGRLLPGLLHFARSLSAEGRLEQPLTYWNAMGMLAGLGFDLCARLAGDPRRPAWMRAGAGACAAPLGMGLYLSFSRGALFACAAGLVALVVLAPRRAQLLALVRCILVGALAAAAAAPFAGVTALSGTGATREGQGLIVLVALIVVAALGALVQILALRRETAAPLRLPRRAPVMAAAVICAGLALAIVLGAHESSAAGQPLPTGATRLVTLQSNRYDYWSVALRAFGQEPLHGVGAGGWSVYWLRWRTVSEFAQDAHSLELQTLAELGIVGAALLLAMFGGLVAAARHALRRAPEAAVGSIATLVAYLAHSPLDWDWQMPAVTLVAAILAGQVLAIAGGGLTAPRRSAAPRG